MSVKVQCVLIGWRHDPRASAFNGMRTGVRTSAGEFEAPRREGDGQFRPVERRLLRRLSTGDIIDRLWTQFAFPTLWHYDVLRALDYLRGADVPPDPRVDEAIAVVLERRQGDGRWRLDVRHHDTLHEELAGAVGQPNRWVTLRARRVLDWYARRADLSASLSFRAARCHQSLTFPQQD